MEEYAIEMRNITLSFNRKVANDDVTLKLRKGEVHALLGENGAGKSTLMNVLFGLYKADSGEIYVNGKKVAGSQLLHPKDIVRIGNTTLPWLMYFTPGYIETHKVANNNDGENSLNKTERNTEKTRQLNSNENSYTITGFVLAFLMPVLGIVFCAIALNAKLKTKENKGFGLAVSGLVISIFNIVVRLIILSAIISAY